MSATAVVWERRLRPRWKAWYVVVSGVIGVGLLWATWDSDRSRRSSGGRARLETWSDVAQLVGVGATMWAVYALFCWAPRARLGRDGIFRYRAVFTSSQLDVPGKGAVVITASPLKVGGKYGGDAIGRWVMEVRPHDDAEPRRRPKLALYQVPSGVVGVASPPLPGEDLARLVSALSAFGGVTLDEATLATAASHGQRPPRVGGDDVTR